MDDYLILSSQWRVAICIQCQQGVKAENVVGHFKGAHHRLSKKQAESIEQQLALTDVIQDSRTFEPISALDEPIPGLRIHQGAFVCVADPACSYTAVCKASMKTHCAIHHKGHRKRSSVEDDSSSWVPVRRYQQMFPTGHGSNYFRVVPISSPINQTAGDAAPVNADDEVKHMA